MHSILSILQTTILQINFILFLPAICFGIIYFKQLERNFLNFKLKKRNNYNNLSTNNNVIIINNTSITTIKNIWLRKINSNSNYNYLFIKVINFFEKYSDLFLIIINILTSNLLCYSDKLINSFVIYELLTIFTIPLVCKDKKNFFYGYYLIIFSTIFLLPIVLFIDTGVLPLSKEILSIICLFSVVKTAIIPMHSWLVSSYKASYPVSSVLHACVMINSGLIFFIQILEALIGIENKNIPSVNSIDKQFIYIILPCLIVVIFSIIYSAFRVLFLKNIKKILIFSTINMSSINLLVILLSKMLNENSLSDDITNFFIFHSISKFIMFILFYKMKIENINEYNQHDQRDQYSKNMKLFYLKPYSLGFIFLIYYLIDHFYENKILDHFQSQFSSFSFDLQDLLLFFNIKIEFILSFLFAISHLYIIYILFYVFKSNFKIIK